MRTFFTLLVLAILGCCGYLYFLSEKYPWDFVYDFEASHFYSFEKITDDVLDTLTNQTQKDTQTYHEALNKKDETICGKIKKKPIKNLCIKTLVIEKAELLGDEHICNTIQDKEDRELCENKRLYGMAVRNEEKYFCEQISNVKLQVDCSERVDSIILDFILKSGKSDEKLCDKLGDSFFRECIKKMKKNKKDETYENNLKAIKNQDCSLFSDKIDKQNCENTALFEKAKATSDVTLCTEIQDADMKKRCLQQVSYTNDMVFFKNATENRRLPVCDKITDKALKTRCRDLVFLDIVRTQKNTSLCQSIKDAVIQKECVSIK